MIFFVNLRVRKKGSIAKKGAIAKKGEIAKKGAIEKSFVLLVPSKYIIWFVLNKFILTCFFH